MASDAVKLVVKDSTYAWIGSASSLPMVFPFHCPTRIPPASIASACCFRGVSFRPRMVCCMTPVMISLALLVT